MILFLPSEFLHLLFNFIFPFYFLALAAFEHTLVYTLLYMLLTLFSLARDCSSLLGGRLVGSRLVGEFSKYGGLGHSMIGGFNSIGYTPFSSIRLPRRRRRTTYLSDDGGQHTRERRLVLKDALTHRLGVSFQT